MKVKDIVAAIEDIAPLSYQQSYDNAGLIVGKYDWELTGALICLDVVEEVVQEAIEKGLNLIISHHPIVFKGLKRFNGNNYVERTVILAIQNNIAIYSAHTNLDSVIGGVSDKMCDVLGLVNRKVLDPVNEDLKKLVTYVPSDKADEVRTSLFESGAGGIGNYDSCSFNTKGEGTFRANDLAKPYVGKAGELHYESEVRIETIFPKHLQGKVISALLRAHPYEEVAYDIYSLENKNHQVGLGMIGELETPMDSLEFMKKLKDLFHCGAIRHTPIVKNKIRKIALCGGSGSSLLKKAKSSKADIYISGDFKYHEFFDAEGKIIIADIGHYESEQFTREIFYEIVTKKFPNFAVRISEINSNPINYL
ncbi:Nif3-like dinuclear metal center hexameric protein [Ancylomarina sp. 16SWW S1-10-2]|uniref:Nif3-like dinuclear metal center hexameric protein n=1 Tax=Ancylomarina sp. 16SWW S1-10-2 TaxID=2499681 RepID=UPI0012ADF56A|nr:Nif3-like dinuclear metal center hexameric protein [Ancylomarina sp. 16SWW S1-10-2]MRT91778.1 Nif3-like dinuclear metal center hexameric protein [Ancylomarina sp. 16SWW S1-10-2]